MRVARELDRLVAERGRPQTIVSDNGDGVYVERDPALGGRERCRLALHRARQADPERLHRELQRPAARRAPERDAVPIAAACAGDALCMADGLQHDATALASRLAHAGRLSPHLPAASAGAAQPRQLRPGDRRFTGLRRHNHPSDSGSGWIKVGGNVRIEIKLGLEPRLARGVHGLAALLSRMGRLFLRVILWRWKKRQIEPRPATTPLSFSFA